MNEDMGRLQGAAPVIDVSSTPLSQASEIRLKVAVVEKLNLADFQNAVPALHELAIVNETPAPISELTITITSEPAFLKPRTWSMDTVGAGETFHIADLDVQLDGSLLSRLTEAEPATLHFELRSRREPATVIAQDVRVVELLARNQWGGIGYAPEMVAAFVQPNDPAVDHVLKAAAQALQGSGKSGSIDGYTHGAKRAWELASGIWTAVLQRKLHYALPPASFEHRGQKVRTPGQIIDAGLATCLDLTLLFASCLEQANLNPLLIFTHGHAFVGMWLRDEEFSTAVVDDITAVRKRLQLQEMLVFETTLAAQGHPVSFSQAISQGDRQLSEGEDDKFELVVDVKRARMSRIKPLALAQAVADQARPIQEPEATIMFEDAPDLPDEVVQEVPTAELDPKDRLARWQRKLLDLSLRNALLNFKQGRKALQLNVDAPTLEDALAEGQTLKLLPSPELMQGRDPRSQELHESRSLEDLRKAHAADALKRRELREIAGRLQANAIAVGSHNLSAGPLTPVHINDWSARWQQEMVRAAQTLGESCDRLSVASRQLCEQLGFDAPVLHRNVRSSLGIIAKALPQAAGKAWSFCALPQSVELCTELKAGVELLSQHREFSMQMSPAWSAELQSQLRQALDLLDQHRGEHAELGVAWPTAVSDELQRGIQRIEEITQLREGLSVKYDAEIAQLNVPLLQREWAKAEKAFWPMSWLGKRKVRRTLESVIVGTDEPRIAEDLAALVRIKGLREEVAELNPGAAAEGVWAGEKTRTDHARCVLKANAALMAARARRPYSLEGLTPAAEGYCGEQWVAEVKRLTALQDLDRRIANCTSLGEASDGLWRGHETDVELLRAALAFEQERLRLKGRGALQAEHLAVAEGRCGSRLQQEHARLKERAALEFRLAGLNSAATHCTGVWAGLDTDTDAIAQALRFHSLLHAGLSGLGLPAAAIDTIRQALHRVLAERIYELNEGGVIGNACQQMMVRLAELNAAVTAFSSNAGQPEEVKRAFADLIPDEMAEVARQLDNAHAGLHAWCAWRNAQAAARSLGLAALIEAIVAGDIEPARVPTAFEVSYARWWLAEAVDEDEVLKRFVSAEHERRIGEFRALDEEFTKVTRQWIRAKLCAGLPTADNVHRNSEWGVLRHEITKKKQHKPLRQLLEEIPSAVLRLTPCLLMSPLSIAQYLSANASSFDIVIFDEASQIPVWDAIGAIARGKQVVMVGDPKQLPPTNFFDRAEASDGDSEDVESDLESILDECLGASLPTRNLSWHYRSRHESLIAFSNHRYYGGGLVTFPSPVTEDSAVSFHFVGGQYEKGGARINQAEARALVSDLVARLKSPGFQQSGLTIGVVTFNSEQQRLIEDMLDAERRKDPGLEPFFAEVELEPVFVKNLESVQGDERDIMYFSITYGPDMSGALSMNFGPLNRDGGERRLNVAVTRARHELRVFSSLRGEQMDLSRTKAIGVRDLKHFLEFAERGTRALAEAHRGSQGDFDSPFESAVATALGRKGWQVHTQIGASSFRIDLGVVHPDLAGRYLAGVECDGATYHRSATARDRDKLREQVLRGLGWEIERIWSTDWWVDPGGTLERVHARLNYLLTQDRERRALEASAQQAASEAAQTVDESARDTAAVLEATLAIARAAEMPPVPSQEVPNESPEVLYARAATTPAGGESVVTNGDRKFRASKPEDAVEAGVVSAELFYESVYGPVLKPMIEWVVQHEGPVLDAVLARRIARAHGFQRTGSRIQERVEHIARQCVGSTEEAAGTFYWPNGVTPGANVAFRWPFDEDSTRGVDEICEQELLSLAHWVVGSGKSGEEALIVMARELGLMKLRAASRGRLEAALELAMG